MSAVHDPFIIYIPSTINSCEFFDLGDHVYGTSSVKIIIESGVVAVIRYSGACFIKHVEIIVGVGAQVFWVAEAAHETISIECSAASSIYYVQVFGAAIAVAQQQLILSMCQEGANAVVRMFPLLQQDQKFECMTVQQHNACVTTTDLQIMGHIEAHAQFCHKSKIFVGENLHGIEVKQKSTIFLASESNAHVCAQPCFDIASKDVRCNHGAAIGAIDKNQLWYVQARGINASDAYCLIIKVHCFSFIDKQLPVYVYEFILSIIIASK